MLLFRAQRVTALALVVQPSISEDVVRFSLRTLFTCVAFVAIATAGICALLELRVARTEIESLRESYGLTSGRDRIEIVTLGDARDADLTRMGCSLIRISNPNKYKVRVVFYDGTTQRQQGTVFDLEHPEFAVTYCPHPDGDRFVLQHTAWPSKQMYFNVDGASGIIFHPIGVRKEIDSNPFLYYVFYTPGLARGPNAAELSDLTTGSIVALCNRYRVKCVFFVLEEETPETGTGSGDRSSY